MLLDQRAQLKMVPFTTALRWVSTSSPWPITVNPLQKRNLFTANSSCWVSSSFLETPRTNALGSAPPGGEGLQNEKNNVNIYMYSVTTLSVSHCYEGTSTNMFTKVCHIFITWFFYVVLFISITNALLKQNAINFEFDNYY